MPYDRTYTAHYDYGPRKKGTRAIVLHFTEGNGTEADVRYIASATVARGVSCHFVITKDGKTWQLLDWGHAAGSIDPSQIRTTDDKPFTSPDGARVVYGVSANQAALADAWRDPNAAVVAVEIAGKAADGPTAAQTASIVALVADFRSRYGLLAALGHRDFADYKPCPGKLLRWGSIGGHGAPEADVDISKLQIYATPKRLNVPKGTHLYDSPAFDETSAVIVSPGRYMPLGGKFAGSDGPYMVGLTPDDGSAVVRLEWRLVKPADVGVAEDYPASDCKDEIAAATASLQNRITAFEAARSAVQQAAAPLTGLADAVTKLGAV